MSTTGDLTCGASGKKVQQAPEYQVEGQPPRSCTPGKALTIPAGAVYAVRNACSGHAAEVATSVAGKAGHRAGRVRAAAAADGRPGVPALEEGHRS